MDIEQLTKAQIVLLTLLVSFITSIATGIVTVTLMDQAPPSMTQVINRVVERTVERVVPDGDEGEQVAAAGEVIKEVTVVVKENDLITESIEKNAKNLVRLSTAKGRNAVEPETFVGIGVMVTSGGIVATDATLVPSERYIVTVADGTHYVARRLEREPGAPIALLSLEANGATFSAATLADLTTLKLGQTAIALSGSERVHVALGSVTGLDLSPDGSLSRLYTDITAGQVQLGSPVFNMFGEVTGLYAGGVSGTEASFVPLQNLATAVSPQ
jgi:S1-C subfamily serine protease